jgi:hypothetical protein
MCCEGRLVLKQRNDTSHRSETNRERYYPKDEEGKRDEQSDGTRKENTDGNLKGKCDHFPTNVL